MSQESCAPPPGTAGPTALYDHSSPDAPTALDEITGFGYGLGPGPKY